MTQYNEYRLNAYDVPTMISQLIKIIGKYPEILSNKQWLDNDELVAFFNENGKLKPIQSLMKVQSKLTKFFVTSKDFLDQTSRN